MAWRPYENLIEGQLDNHIPGKVSGWIRFLRRGKQPLTVNFDLAGDFHEDIRGTVIRLTNPSPSDRSASLDRKGTYMDGFSAVQQGEVGDITAGLSLGPLTEELAQRLMRQHELAWDETGLQGLGRELRRKEFAEHYRAHIEAGDLYYPYVNYPYIEWYSETNGRVVLELEPSQVEVIKVGASSLQEKTSSELASDERKRIQAMGEFLSGMVSELSDENRRQGGDGNVSGGLVG
jgi:hypothetical protein